MFKEKKFWTFAGLYGVLSLASLPLLLGWVPPNRWYGFRMPDMVTVPSRWYEINEVGARYFIAAMGICFLLNLLVFWIAPPVMRNQAGWINGALIVLSFWLVTLEILPHLSG